MLPVSQVSGSQRLDLKTVSFVHQVEPVRSQVAQTKTRAWNATQENIPMHWQQQAAVWIATLGRIATAGDNLCVTRAVQERGPRHQH